MAIYCIKGCKVAKWGVYAVMWVYGVVRCCRSVVGRVVWCGCMAVCGRFCGVLVLWWVFGRLWSFWLSVGAVVVSAVVLSVVLSFGVLVWCELQA